MNPPRIAPLMMACFVPRPGRLITPDVRCDLAWVNERVILMGPVTHARPSMESRHPILLASFDPLAVRGWLNVPLHLLTDCSIPLAEISPNLAPVVAENMLAGLSNALTLPGESALELNLSKRLALAAAELRRGATVRVAASAVEWSERQLERVFLSEMGLTPKMFARIGRLRRAIAFANAGTTLSTAAYSAGYADQSHFNRDMRALMGGSPSSLLQHVGNAKDIVDGEMAD